MLNPIHPKESGHIDLHEVWPAAWELQVWWRPCGTSAWPEWQNHTIATMEAEWPCQYASNQRVLAFAKSGDAKRGFLLLTRSGEIGIFTDTLHSAPFRWQDLRSDRWHWLRAVGEKGSTTFYCNGQEVATIPGNPGSRWPERFGGDIDARNPQGAGLIRKIQFQIPTSRSCKAN